MNDYYQFQKYDYLIRWISYWHQINEVLKLRPKTVLEIGIGNKTVRDCLKNTAWILKLWMLIKKENLIFSAVLKKCLLMIIPLT